MTLRSVSLITPRDHWRGQMATSDDLQNDKTVEQSEETGGDQILVDGIQDSGAVAIGRGATAVFPTSA